MKQPIRTLEQKLKVLGNRSRLKILRYLRDHHSATVSQLAKKAQISVVAASQHLRILKSAGIVRSKKRGVYVTYHLALQQEKLVKGVLVHL